jgi:hypothetical protein
MSLFDKYKKTGSIINVPVVEKKSEEKKPGLFTKAARFLLPKNLEYKWGITPRPEEKPVIEEKKYSSLFEKYKETGSISEKVDSVFQPTIGRGEVLKQAPPEIPEKDTLFKKMARFVLPKNLELKLKLRKPTKAEEIWQHGKDLDEYYGRGEDFIGGVKTFGEGIKKLPKATAVAVLQATQGYEGASVVNKDWADRYITDANIDMNKFINEVSEKYKNKILISGLPLKITEFAEFPQNLAFSLTSMGAGLGVGAPISFIPLPGARAAAWALGTAASGKVAYEMTSYQIMQQYLEAKNDEKIAKTGKELTLEEENHLKEEFGYEAMKYGLWEAIPEAISNLGFVSILTAPLLRMGISRTMTENILTKLTALYGEELLTETITQKGQSDIEVRAGLREGKISWIEAFREVAPQTFLLTTIMAGAGSTIIQTKKGIDKIKNSLKNEIGEGHPLYNEIKDNITKDIKTAIKPEAPPIQPQPIPQPITTISQPVAPPTPQPIIPSTPKEPEFKKGEIVQIKSRDTNNVESIEFVSQRDDGIMAKRKGVNFPMLFRDTKWEIIKEVPKETPTTPKEAISFDPLKSTKELENNLLKIAKKGTGQFNVGEVYSQNIIGKQRPVIISKVNPDGSVEGFYMGAVSATEKDFGIGIRSLQPARWNNPAKELQVGTFSQESLNKLTSKVFGIDAQPTPKELEPLAKEGHQIIGKVEDLIINKNILKDLPNASKVKVVVVDVKSPEFNSALFSPKGKVKSFPIGLGTEKGRATLIPETIVSTNEPAILVNKRWIEAIQRQGKDTNIELQKAIAHESVHAERSFMGKPMGEKAEISAEKIEKAITTQATKQLEPLAQEARKYKSAEEFIEKQRVTTPEIMNMLIELYPGREMTQRLTDFYTQATKQVKPEVKPVTPKASDEFKVGDVLDPQGKTNMVGNVKIREITGNTLKFIDSKGTEFAGLQRSQVRILIKEGSWKRVKEIIKVKSKVPEKVKRDKPIVETKIDLIESGESAEIQANILMELEFSEKGSRIHWTEPDGTPKTIGVNSSFPKWIPENLRSRKLFDNVLNHIKNDTLPIKADEVRLYNVVAEQLGLTQAIKDISKEEEIDVSKLFADEKINEQISKVSRGEEAKVAEEIERSISKQKEIKAPGGMATIGKFADTEVKLGGMDKIRPVEFPELVELTNDLMGRVPEVSRRLRTALGKFYGVERGRIKLTPDLFKKENSGQLAKTLAHEIGHLVDYLPHETLKRGNLLGSLLSLRGFLKNQYGEVEITNKEIRDELKAVSKYWRPWDESTAMPSYKSYRNSARELYADAVSVLLNSPGTLEGMAPKFYESFFKYLDEKPAVKESYFNLQEILSHDRATLVQLRRERVKEMFDAADYKSKELQDIKEKQRKIRLKDFWEMFKYGVKSINQPVYNKVKELQKKGIGIPDEQNPEYLLSGRNYLSGKVKGEFKENIQPIMKDLFKNDIDWKTFGEFLFYERIVEGDRSEFANPRGITPKAAEELRESIKQSLGDRYGALEENANKFRGFLKRLATEAYEAGMYRQEMFDIMKGDDKYVPFQVLEYMENYVAWKAKPQVGTLKDVNNPANSLLLKAVSTMRAIENQKDRVATFEMLENNYPGEIKEAELQFTGKAQRPVPSRDSNFEMVTYYKDGKLRGKYVDPYIAKSLEKDTIAVNRAVMTMLSPIRYLNQKLFRPVFVVYNPGWIPFNFIRDFMRFWKNTPGMTMYRAAKLYGKALRPARVRVFAKERTKIKDIEAEKLITKLEKEKVLSVTWNDFLMGQTSEDAQIQTIFEKMGLVESEKEIPVIRRVFDKILKYTGIGPVLRGINNVGQLIETLPKVAGYYALEGKMAPNEMRTFIRRNVGSPDFFEKGYLTAATNDIFLFSNAFIQAVSADVNIATDPKTRGGFWWKTAKVTYLPKIIMFLALLGGFGDEVKKMMEDASEYDLTNYIVIPIGKDSKNGKTVYLRIPQDETSRLLGGVLWKVMYGFKNDQGFIRDMADIASLFGGQLPSLTPAIEVPLSAFEFLGGQNPYDSFRGRHVLTEKQFKAGGWYAGKPFLLWMFQQMGGNIFMKFYAGEQSPKEKSAGEKFLQIPIVSNVIGRFVRVSDYGSIEKYRDKLSVVQQEQARKSIDETKIINKYIKKVQNEEGTKEQLYRDMVVEILGDTPKNSEEKDKAERLKKKFKIGILKGESDSIINSFISAYTNEEKLTLLRVFEKDMNELDFLELKKTLLEYKIVSKEVFKKFKNDENI